MRGDRCRRGGNAPGPRPCGRGGGARGADRVTARGLIVRQAGLAASVQDLGRPGYQRQGVAEGGAVDPRALVAGAAILGQAPDLAAVELVGMGGQYEAFGGAVRVALTGAAFKASLDGRPVRWNTSFVIEPGQVLALGGCEPDSGVYGYLHLGGGIEVPRVLGSRSTHLRAVFGGHQGRLLRAGDRLVAGPDAAGKVGLTFDSPWEEHPKVVRVLWGVQAGEFAPAERERFTATTFTVTPARDRMGMKLDFQGAPFVTERSLTLISDAVVLGDVQIPGDGKPIVLLADRQPTGGYPRLATVITADLPALAQLPAGARFRFQPVSEAMAVEALKRYRHELGGLAAAVRPVLRSLDDVAYLLSVNLIDGVISGDMDDQ
ncbi:MAG: biotin-dependent carboxyltransferase family protein [Geminicoccaceae bacterium]|nr:MAG: biotin-dependent carboxyltransferase family protein [Geminicoccaceae bacterium]